MKKIIVLFLATLVTTNIALANDLPLDFYINDKSGFDVSSKSMEDVSSTLKGYFEASNKMNEELHFTSAKAASNWQFAGFITTLGVTSSGKLGIVGFKGTAATEIHWREKKPETKSLRLEEGADNRSLDMEADLEFSDLSPESIDDQVENAFALVKASGKVSNLDVAKIGIRQRLKEFAEMVRQLYSDTNRPYYFAGLRYDLTVSASGAVGATPFTIAGSVIVRMIWRPIKRIDPAFAQSSHLEGRSDLQKVIDDTALSLESMNEVGELKDKGLKLQVIRVGYGKSLDGKIQLIGIKSSLIFSALFTKNPKYRPTPASFRAQTFATTSIKSGDGSLINWNQFQKGLKKALKISRPFLNRAEKMKDKWEVGMVRLTFTASATRGIGLVTVGDIGQFEIDFTK